MVDGYPWGIDDTRSPDETRPRPTSALRQDTEADFDMEGPHEPFIPRLDTKAASIQKISTVQAPTYAQIAQTVAIQAQA
ncbi:MAG: hypothetical protein NTX63_02660 [Candidatus Peregrinibacteria bacterium]|nr:hypothetical protein [Candidatus Peregrinibacteria bacterium]